MYFQNFVKSVQYGYLCLKILYFWVTKIKLNLM